MKEVSDIPMLYSLLFGEAAEVAQRGASERLKGWAMGFEAWLGERREGRASTVKTARLAWGRLLRQCGKMPWEVEAGDIEEHASWMLREGYSPNTAYSAQGMILDFTHWAYERRLDAEWAAGGDPAGGDPGAEVRRLRGRGRHGRRC